MSDDLKGDMSDNRYDFAKDTDVVPPADPAFDSWIERVAPTLNNPKAVPRHEMWKAIQAARATGRDAQAGAVPGVTPLRRKPWRLMSVIAAALLLGVALDRAVLRRADRPADRVATVPPSPADTNDATRLYRMAAAQTLTQAEALLIAYRASGDPAAMPQLGSWGRDVLSSTRLLIDSPAGDDPRLRALLNDLELVLVQIIQLSGAQLDPSERGLIDRALEERDLLPRIRTAVPSGVAAAEAASSD